MKFTVLGGGGGYPDAGGACGGYLFEYEDIKLLIDPGYATFPKLSELLDTSLLDAVIVSHGHPDHCSDINPLLRSRALGGKKNNPLPIYAPHGSLKAVLSLDSSETLAYSYEIHAFTPGSSFKLGSLLIETRALPHFILNAGIRMTGSGLVVSYTGDCGFTPELEDLARDSDLFLAESTYVDNVDRKDAPFLSSATQSARIASRANVKNLVLTHTWPGTDSNMLMEAAKKEFKGRIEVARYGLNLTL